jgi:hypothetical protein
MALLDKIKGFFTKASMPDETRLLLAGVENVHELRKGLDVIITRNEVELKDVEREIDKLEKIELAEKDKVKAGTLPPREKDNTLRYIKTLRTRMDSYQKRHKIYQQNIDLHLSLLDRIDEMEAMELKAVTQEQISEIAVDYDEKREKHNEIIDAYKATIGETRHDDQKDKKELEALEKEILAENGETAEPEKADEPTPEPEEPEPEEPAEPEKAEKPTTHEDQKRAPLEVEPKEKPKHVPTSERRLELE